MILIYMQSTIDHMFNTDSHSVREIEMKYGIPDINTIVGSTGDVIKYYKFKKKSPPKKSLRNI